MLLADVMSGVCGGILSNVPGERGFVEVSCNKVLRNVPGYRIVPIVVLGVRDSSVVRAPDS